MIVKSARPNGHLVQLVRTNAEEDEYEVRSFGPDDEENDFNCTSIADAQVRFDAEVKRLAKVPNWAAQEAYDREHGTVNGGVPDFSYWRD